MSPHMQELLERGVTALELLAQDPVIQMETGPPVCPHCNEMNPLVLVHESEARGKLAEFVIQAQCLHCDSVFYAIPVQWDTVQTTEQAAQLIAERAEITGYARKED